MIFADLNLICNDKGGVGRSWTTLCLSWYLQSQGQDFYLVNADSINPCSNVFFTGGEPKERHRAFVAQSLKQTEFDTAEGKDLILNCCREKTTIVDLPARTTTKALS